MNTEKLLNRINEEDVDGYLMTLTVKKKDRLNHYAVTNNFPIDDIHRSLDESVRLLNIIPPSPPSINIPRLNGNNNVNGLKIAILTHFNRMPEYYSPGRAVKGQIKMLKKYGNDVVLFLQEKSALTEEDVGCEIRNIVTSFKREKNIVDEEAKNKFIKALEDANLIQFDVVLTHDLYIDDCETYREGIKEYSYKNPTVKFLHWARSGVGNPIDFNHPCARYIYMNYSEAGVFASRIGVPDDKIRIVFNIVNFGENWNEITKAVVNKMKLWEKDIIQAYPLCSTRMEAKGIDSVIRTFGHLKSIGNKVGIIFCNSNAKNKLKEIEEKKIIAYKCGLDVEKDILFTSDLINDVKWDVLRDVPHKSVLELMQLSNLFIFPSKAEVCSNALAEASMSKNLIVINRDLPSLFDFVDRENVLSHSFSSIYNINYSGTDDKSLKELADKISEKISSNCMDKQFRNTWRNQNEENVYYNQLLPILME